MAQLAIAVAGAAILGPAGLGLTTAGTGFLIGSTAASLLGVGAPNQQGPRLSDTKVQISSYGAALARCWGGYPLTGNVIWSTGLKESSSTQSAKGGPTTTTYSYSASFAVAFGQGVIPGFRKMWLDSKLVVDFSDTAESAAQAASSAFMQYVTWHTGSETQTPDATIEAVEGVGTVEAYRGVAYLVFTGLPLADYGNRLPQVRIETTTAALSSTSFEQIKPGLIGPWLEGTAAPSHTIADPSYVATTNYIVGGGTYSGTDWNAAVSDMAASYPGMAGNLIAYKSDADDSDTGDGGASGLMWNSLHRQIHINTPPYPGSRYVYLQFGPVSSDQVTPLTCPNGYGVGLALQSFGAFIDDGFTYCMRNCMVGLPGGGFTQGRDVLLRVHRNDAGANVRGFGFVSSMTNYPAIIVGSKVYYPALYVYLMPFIRAERLIAYPTRLCVPGDPVALGAAEVPGSSDYCITATGGYYRKSPLTVTSGSFKTLQDNLQGAKYFTHGALGPTLRSTDPNYSNSAFWTAAATAAGVSGTYGVDYPVAVSTAAVGTVTTYTVAAGTVPLSTIVSDICLDAGLLAGQIDVTALASISVQGYGVARVVAGRQWLEPLRQAFAFDAVESEGKIRFVRRGASPVAALTFNDIGAGVDTATEPVDHTRAQESELPAELTVSYPVRAAGYEIGTQASRRSTVGSTQQTAIEIPVVMTDTQAAGVADVLMYDTWTARNTRKFTTGRAWTVYEPTDVVTLNDGDFSYTLRLIDKSEDGATITWEARDDDAASYSPNASGAATPYDAVAATISGPTNLQPLDCPLLRDADNSPGYYLAASGYGPGWAGGNAYRSTDGGANYDLVQQLTRKAIIGFASTVLASHPGGNTVDEANTVDITVHDGQLASITRAQLLNLGNAAILGDEVINFQRASLVSGTTWRLSGLLRGRLGTERFMASHALKERFVVLDAATLYRVPSSLAQIGTATLMKGVTYGQTVDTANAKFFVDTGAALRPLAPINLVAPRSTSGVYQARWQRRSRMGTTWISGSDVILGETNEAYRVRVFDSSTAALLLELTTSTPNAAVGDGVTDYTGKTLDVCQLSATVGAGTSATIIL